MQTQTSFKSSGETPLGSRNDTGTSSSFATGATHTNSNSSASLTRVKVSRVTTESHFGLKRSVAKVEVLGTFVVDGIDN